MVYPNFVEENIFNRCIEDIKQFFRQPEIIEKLKSTNDENQENKDFNDYITKNKSTKNKNTENELINIHTIFLDATQKDYNEKKDLVETVEPILSKIKRYIGDNDDYILKISTVSEYNQIKLWICRTYLFYLVFIFEVKILKKKDLYNDVYQGEEISLLFPFREDIIEELDNYKMGIFGSLTPTSDIDIGIHYSGTTMKEPSLDYIISRFESLFLILTEKNTLQYDIEAYADMFTLPNKDTETKEQYPDYYYLDATKLNDENFKKLLDSAFCSIARNAIIAHKDVCDDSTIQLEKIVELPKTLEYTPFDILDKYISSNYISQDELNEKFKNALEKVNEYLDMDYNTARKKYYEKVKIAETLKLEKTGTENIRNLGSDDICDILYAIGESNTYRMESYICIPTIVHIVRIFQALKNNTEQLEKYKTSTPQAFCDNKIQNLDPYCTVGKYGYILSMLEQIGYLYRFDLEYCNREKPCHMKEEHEVNEEKCNKKLNKYKERYEDGYAFFNKITENEKNTTIEERKTRKTKTKTKKTKTRKTKTKKTKTRKTKTRKTKTRKTKTKK